MSIVAVRPFFRTRMDGLGYTEWEDGFNFNNIPSTIIDGAYHIEGTGISAEPSPQLTHRLSYGVTVRLIKKGFLNIKDALDAIDQDLDDILVDILDVNNRLSTGIKDIVPLNFQSLPLSDSNDNAIILEMQFSATLVQYFRT